MNNLFQENRKNAFILLGLLFILLIVVYFLFYYPLSKDFKSTGNQVTNVENDIELLRVQIENAGENIVQGDDLDRLRFADQLPMNPDTEEIILMLEEIEFVSESRIESIGFSYDGSMPNQVTVEEEVDSEENEDELVNEEQTREEIEPVIDMEEKPENLQVITMNLSVSSPNYEQFQVFIREIEKQERMMMVSNMDFQQLGEEIVFEENPDESIYSSINVTTFYYGE